MRIVKSLNQQLVLTMAGVAGATLALMSAGIFLFYTFVYYQFFSTEDLPEIPDPSFYAYWPTLPEWVTFFTLWGVGLTITIAVSTRFARKLIRPLETVAEAARKIALGDLGARASQSAGTFAETKQLVEDFNHMAVQLGQAETEMRMWAAAIAHELRTPLTILRGQLQGFADGVFTPDVPTFQKLVAQVEGLSRIVDDLRILTLVQNDRFELRCETINLAREVESVATVMGPELERAGLSLHLDLGSVEFSGDGARIRQVVAALLENARIHAGPGAVRIETRATRERAILRISDTGPGLSEEAVAHVFDPFWRVDSCRSRSRGGSGLGLAVVKAITQAHGGTVSVAKGNPSGAVFEINLPKSV